MNTILFILKNYQKQIIDNEFIRTNKRNKKVN